METPLKTSFPTLCRALLLVAAFCFFTAGAMAQKPVGPTNVIVQSMFGGQIFGFDIDQNGTEGILAEAQTLSNGKVLAAVETFDQKTGKILKVLVNTQTQDDYLVLGVTGHSVGLIEREHVISLLDVQRTYKVVNPLSTNKFTGNWTPPINKNQLIMSGAISRTQGSDNVAVFVFDNSGNFTPQVLSSNVAANTFGPPVTITDSTNFGSVPPPIGYNTVTNEAVLGGGTGSFDRPPVIGVADLTAGTFSEFTGVGFGFVNGIAVDSADGIACTTTEDDATVEFLTPATQGGFGVQLPNSGGQQFFSGADVEFDTVHKMFLVAQPNSSSSSGSSIYVYDTRGNVKETLNGFNFSNAFNVVAAHVALNPSRRIGYVDGPNVAAGQLQQFTY
jgi:hypothetical protein